MKVAIMQPYLFPYIGYWQLLGAVDKFVVLDDVNYIVRGFIARNSILLDGKAHMFSVPVDHASQNRLICDTKLSFTPSDKHKFIETLKFAYRKAPRFEEGLELVTDIVMNGESDLTDYIVNSIEKVKNYLDIKTPLVKSSDIYKDPSLRSQDRIIAICKALGAETYINLPGGRGLYTHERFHEDMVELLFLDPAMEKIRYPQFDNEFVSYLSIIDFIMFNDVPAIKKLLEMYTLNAG